MSSVRGRIIGLVVALVVGLVLAPTGSSAAGPVAGVGPAMSDDPVALAEALFQDGKRLLERGDAHAACPKLAESLRLDRATGTLLALAMCHEVDGHLASAWAEYLEVVARAKKDGRLDREEAARQYARALEARLSTLSIAVPAAVARIPGLVVERDGVALESPVWSMAVPLDPGPHVVSATAAGRQVFITTVVVGAGADHQTVVVPLLAPDESDRASSLTSAGGDVTGLAARMQAVPPYSGRGAPRFTASVTGALAASDGGGAAAAELAVANRAGWGAALRGTWPASGRTEPIDGGGAVSLRSFVLRAGIFRRFRSDRVFSAEVGPEILWQLDRADATGLAGAQSTWRGGWGVGIGGGLEVPLARFVGIAVLASVDYAPAGWGSSVAVANRGDVLRPGALRALVAAGPRFAFDW